MNLQLRRRYSARHIADVIRRGAPLVTLDLSYCLIGDQGAKAIADAIVQAGEVCQMRTLHLCNCGIALEGGKALARALRECPSLLALYMNDNPLHNDAAHELYGPLSPRSRRSLPINPWVGAMK